MTAELISILLASLRLGPILGFAPPFTLVPMPMLVRAVLVIALAAVFVGTQGAPSSEILGGPQLAIAAAGELALGIAMALPLQLAFAAIAMAGRALDIQAGFGLAFVIDPTTKAQTPLIGAVFAYAAAAVFFATGGPHDLLAILAANFGQLPLGFAMAPIEIASLIEFLGVSAIMAFGLVGLAVLVLFMIDLAIAMLSRTLPQMNMLVLGFQVKAMAALLLLPATLGLAGAGIVGILRLALEAMAGGA